MPPRVKQNTEGDFYVADQQCLLCLVPLDAAPHLMSLFDSPDGPAGSTCYFSHQPTSETDVDAAIRAMTHSCCGALRYGGRDPDIIGKLKALGLATQCDYPG
jgi:hypothetical protein